MFYSKEFRIFVTALLVAFAGYLIFSGSWGWSIWVFLLAALVVLTIFRNEQVIIAMVQLRQKNMEKAEIALLKIKKPEGMLKGQQAYYHLLMGMLAGNRITGMGSKEAISTCEKHLKMALSIGLKNSSDRASARVNLAGIAIGRRRKMEATQLLNEAKKEDKTGMLSEQIKMMKDTLKKMPG